MAIGADVEYELGAHRASNELVSARSAVHSCQYEIGMRSRHFRLLSKTFTRATGRGRLSAPPRRLVARKPSNEEAWREIPCSP